MWVREEDCAMVIEEEWKLRECMDVADLKNKLVACGEALTTWSNTRFKHVSSSIRMAKENLQNGLVKAEGEGDASSVKIARKQLDEWLTKEEIMWRQRSKQLWLREGDKNTRFFHSVATKRREQNWIDKLKAVDGRWMEGHQRIEEEAVGYFKELFKTGFSIRAATEVCSLVTSQLSGEMQQWLASPFDEEEVRAALKEMDDAKSPGPDGLNACFFKQYWGTIQAYLIRVVLAVLNEDERVDELNETYIVLIPKKINPEAITEFRPISLCNIGYKLVAKTLANRMQRSLGEVITSFQSAFIPGRSIYDNSIVAHEIVHTMQHNKRGKPGEIALKLDMSKAYDRIEWGFLEEMMRVMEFPSAFRRKIMNCVTSVSYAVLINGVPSEFFIPRRGLRQGDPLSPYLFILCVEGFAALMARVVEEGRLEGVAASVGGPKISHLFFAYDSLMFMQAQDRDCQVMREVLSRYEAASGQLVNLEKSAIFFSAGVNSRRRTDLMSLLNVHKIMGKEKYLGLPLMIGKAIKQEFASIKERIEVRLQSWSGRLLTQQGKGVLIRSVVQSIPTFTMACFMLPKSFFREVNSMVANFWWGGKDGKKKMHWLSWEKLCLSKFEGGQGFKDLDCFNKAMLAKTWWRLLHDENLLSHQVLRAKYCAGSPLRHALIAPKCSYLWKSLMVGRDWVEEGALWRVGDGASIDVWGDKWLRQAPMGRPQWNGRAMSGRKFVSSFIDNQTRTWKQEELEKWLLPRDVDLVMRIRLGRERCPDRLIWVDVVDGNLTVKEAYKKARRSGGAPMIVAASQKRHGRCCGVRRWLPKFRTMYGELSIIRFQLAWNSKDGG